MASEMLSTAGRLNFVIGKPLSTCCVQVIPLCLWILSTAETESWKGKEIIGIKNLYFHVVSNFPFDSVSALVHTNMCVWLTACDCFFMFMRLKKTFFLSTAKKCLNGLKEIYCCHFSSFNIRHFFQGFLIFSRKNKLHDCDFCFPS